MARHPEVKQSDIIQAGLALEKTGKIPNPGAIRAQLGFKGGLLRIKKVWESHIDEREQSYVAEKRQHFELEALPLEISENMGVITSKLTESIERSTVQAYQLAQSVFEKRLNSYHRDLEAKTTYFASYEKEIDDSLKQSENELLSSIEESKKLAEQNANLIVENATLKGELKAVSERLQKFES